MTYMWISVMFLTLSLGLGIILTAYWTNLLIPRLRREAEFSAKLLAQSQAESIARILVASPLSPNDVADVVNMILLFSDSADGNPFFLGLELEVDYDVVDAIPASLDFRQGAVPCSDCIITEIPIYSPLNYEVLAIATFYVSDTFFKKLKDELRSRLTVALTLLLGLLATAWIAIIVLVRRLHGQVAARRQAEVELIAHERKYHRLVENLSKYFVYTRNADGTFASVSSSFEIVLGYPPEEINSVLTNRLTSSPVNDNVMKNLTTTSSTQNPFIYEVEVLAKSGDPHRIEFCDIYWSRHGDAIERVEGIARDITQQRNFEATLNEAKEQAETSNRAKSKFLATISHEIRTPIHAILGFTSILQNLVAEPKEKFYLNAIRSSGKTLLGLINDILDLSKLEAGRVELQHTPVHLASLYDDVRQIFSHDVESKNLTFETVIEPGIPSVLSLDEIRMRQILFNLIGNAVKFTESGYIRLSAKQIRNNTAENTIELMISVEDSGIGIPEDQFDVIFGAFQQPPGQSQAKYGGAGLGLAITRRLVETLGGGIRLDSEVGKGSIFTVLLPNVTIADVDDLAAKPEAAPATSVKFQPATVLLADDDKSNRDLVRGYLADQTITIIEAADGEEVMRRLRETVPQLIILDLKMPVLNGHEAARRIRSNPKFQHIPIIAMTASMPVSTTAEKHDAFDVVLHKPIDQQEFLSELTRFLRYENTDSHRRPKPATEDVRFDNPLPVNEKLRNLPELVARLDSELPAWRQLSKTMMITELRDFALRIRDLGGEHGYPPLSKWGETLHHYAVLFEIEKIHKTMAVFPQFVTKMQSQRDMLEHGHDEQQE